MLRESAYKKASAEEKKFIEKEPARMKEFFNVCFADCIFNLNAITIMRMLTRHMADNHYSLASIDKCH